jgi:hypothetical protein
MLDLASEAEWGRMGQNDQDPIIPPVLDQRLKLMAFIPLRSPVTPAVSTRNPHA